MALPKNRRYRGFVLTSVGLQKLRQQIQRFETQTKIRQSPRSIAERVQLADPDGIHPITVRKILSGQEGVDKRSIDRIFRVMQLSLEASDYAHAELCRPNPEQVSGSLEMRQDCLGFGDSGATCFYGRTVELEALSQSDRQLRLLLGMGGIGKTALATEFVRKTQAEFEFVVWKSLRHAPTLLAILRDILQDLLRDAKELPSNLREITGLLVETLQQHRCLLVLDHADAVLSSRLSLKNDRESDEAYEEFLQIIAAVPHQSCLLLTSREQPKVLGLLAEAQVLQLTGLSTVESQQLFQKQGNFSGSLESWRSLVDYYGGNPLMLRQVAMRIQTYFDGSISEYLKDLKLNSLVFGDLCDLLRPQFSRLTVLERSLISHLAAQSDWISVQRLRAALSPVSQRYLLELLDSLAHRSLLDRQGAFFKLQPVVADYVNEYLIEQQIEHQVDGAIEFKAKREVA